MPITVILELWLKPESVPSARDLMRRALQDTRAFDGNVDDRVPVCFVPGRDGTAGHKQHIRTRHISERRVNAQVH
jgi:hypothetical protein